MSVEDHLSIIGGVEASRMEVMLDGISPSSFGATSWSFPAMNVWVEVTDPYSKLPNHLQNDDLLYMLAQLIQFNN